MDKKKPTAFDNAGAEKETGILGEFFAMVKENKKYWLIPIVLMLLVLGLLILLGGTAAAPFIYTLF